MSHDPEEELLDQHLREAFSEFELPPARRVWKGIEGQMQVLPGTSPLRVPLKFLLPAIALAGVAVGWLLPRPTPAVPAATTPAARVVAVRATLLPPTMAAAAPTAPSSANSIPSVSLIPAVASSRQWLAASPSQPAPQPMAVAPLAPQALVLATALDSGPVVVPVFETDSKIPEALEAASYISAISGAQSPPASGAAQVFSVSEAPRADGQQEFHAEFRQPTHRRAEKGRGIRRRLAAVGQWARQLMSPHRARTTGQPSF